MSIAMEVEDDTREGSVSYVILESLESTQKGDKLSAEDLAWVDSCLTADTENSESNWTSLKDALLEIIDNQPVSVNPSATGCDSFAGGTMNKIVPSVEEAKAANYSGRTDDFILINGDSETNTNSIPKNWRTGFLSSFAGGTKNKIVPSVEEAKAANYSGRTDGVIPINGDSETNTNSIPKNWRTGFLSQYFQEDSTETFQEDSSETFRGDPFLPTYIEDESRDEAIDLGFEWSLSATEMSSSTVDIFRVWDLDIPAEEGDLMKQLNKAIAETETSFQLMPSASTAWEDLKDDPVDNLIGGIADLSLDTKI